MALPFDPFIGAVSPVTPVDVSSCGLRLQALVGGGGYGEVFEALDSRGSKFAVKVFRSEKCRIRGVSALPSHGVREICALMELRHPHVLRLFAVVAAPQNNRLSLGRNHRSLWVVTELCATDLSRVGSDGSIEGVYPEQSSR